MTMQIIAWCAALLVYITFFMKTMVPLRVVGIVSNVAFIAYGIFGIYEGIFDKVLPILVLHLALLPLNIVRLNELRNLIRSVRSMQDDEHTYEFLTPFMTRIHQPAGSYLFKQGDQANDVFVLQSGTLALEEWDKHLPEGAMFGEVAVFSKNASRTASAHCKTDCVLLKIAGSKILDLFYQDRHFAFKIARMLAGYARPVLRTDA